MSMESTNNHSAACYQPIFDSCPSSSSDLCHCLVTGALAAQAMGLLPLSWRETCCCIKGAVPDNTVGLSLKLP